MREIYKQAESGAHAHIRQHNGAWLLQVYAPEARKPGAPFVRQFLFPTLQEARWTLRRELAR